MEQIVDQSNDMHAEKKPMIAKKQSKIREFKVVGDEPPRMHIKTKVNMSYCPMNQQTSKTDIQVKCYLV